MWDRRLLSSLALAVLAAQCATRPHTRTEIVMPAPAQPASPAPAPDAFREIVKPMLARHCSPCHVPGGRMYAAMPFDDPEVVRSHEEGILKRIKQPADRDPLIAWLRSPSPPPR